MFVDDAVRGTLPGVCAKDGTVTASGMTIREVLGDRAGMGLAWLLLLAGPFGWLGLFVISVARGGRREVLTVKVPLSDPAYERLRTARRMQTVWLTTALLAPLALLAVLTTLDDTSMRRAVGLLAAAGLVVSVAGLLVNEARLRRARIGVDLDASRRWVTLSGVHPAFVEACRAHERANARRT